MRRGVQWIFLFGAWFNESLQLAYTRVRSVRVPKPSDMRVKVLFSQWVGSACNMVHRREINHNIVYFRLVSECDTLVYSSFHQ